MKKYFVIMAIFAALPTLAKLNPIEPKEAAAQKARKKLWRRPEKIMWERIEIERDVARKKLTKFVEDQAAEFKIVESPKTIDEIKKRILQRAAWNVKAYIPLTPMEVTNLANWLLNTLAEEAMRKTAPIHSPVRPNPAITPVEQEPLRPIMRIGFATEKDAKNALKVDIRKMVAWRISRQEILDTIRENWEKYKPLDETSIKEHAKEWIDYPSAD